VTRPEEIARNLAAVEQRIARAEAAAGRPAGSVRLVAVSKTMPPDDLRAALAAGQLDLGENYAQELRDKRAALSDATPAPRWHFIGPLQSNKVKYVAGGCALVHALDSVALLEEANRRVPEASTQDCLVQVNVDAEPQKRGVAPTDLPALLDAFARLPRLRCRGLMLIPPLSDDPEAARPSFASLRRLRDAEAARERSNVSLVELSMGMSHDLEVAIAEGATIVRVGTAIFGERRRA
jgi:pyridoxal phosphate enzyme (YggS family)